MKDEERKKPEQEKENYAEHLARVIPDADHSKALLQAHYKALHTDPPIKRPTGDGSSHETEE